MTDAQTLTHLRVLLAVIFWMAATGTAGELLLAGHTEGPWQVVPLAMLGAGALAWTWARVSGRRLAMRAFQGVMLATLASAAAGLWWHYRGNVAFELEMYPDLAGWALFWKSIHGTSPPSLAPGTMALIGLIGLAWSYRHPAFYGDVQT